MAHLITFPIESISETDTAQILLEFPDGSGGINAVDQSIYIQNYGNIELSYELDDPFMIPANYTLKIVDGSGYLFALFFPSSGDPAPVVTLKINGVIEFIGKTIEDSILYDYETQVFTIKAAPRMDAINKQMIFDLDGDPVNPFGYTETTTGIPTFYSLTQLLEDIFQLVNSSISYSGGDIEISHGWEFKAFNVTPPYGEALSGLTFADLRTTANRFFFDDTTGIRNVGDVLRRIAQDFGAFAGMLSENKAFLKQLFYYDSGNTQTIDSANIIARERRYSYGLIDFVRAIVRAPLSTDINYDEGTETTLEDRYLLIDTLVFLDGAIYFDGSTQYAILNHNTGGTNYNILQGKLDGVSATYISLGSLLAKFWHGKRSSLINCRTDFFQLIGVNYDFLKDFSIGGEKFQILKLTKRLSENITEIEALNLGTV